MKGEITMTPTPMADDNTDDPVLTLIDAVLELCQQQSATPGVTQQALLVMAGSGPAGATGEQEFEQSLAAAHALLDKWRGQVGPTKTRSNC